LTFANAHVCCLAVDDPELRKILTGARVVAADGVSVCLAAILTYGVRLRRCMMTRAFEAYLATTDLFSARALLIGTTTAQAERAAVAINRASRHLRVVDALSGFLEDTQYRHALQRSAGIDVVLVGMGTPRSEKMLRLVTDECPDIVAWHIGAGTIKCFAGTKQRAPEWVGRCGLEWAHRFAFEPHTRKRYLGGLPVFAGVVFRDIARRVATRAVGGGGPGAMRQHRFRTGTPDDHPSGSG
jgi:N-acetylglucosaminyldiphosphoundecaprenol N-acetyl-beta-D-mannosaminyltransferase